ncbi:MAG: prepilin-type N-terminal cleavage/methylation domain-containing protein [Clostridiales bacterium]|nr:prepilin-type N-terminal cleavage/methylation domain-containing protein [Clostridiales bacterium]
MNNKKGFTLVELVAVIAILGILAGIAVPKFIDSRVTAERSAVEANLKTIESAITLYEVQIGSIPDNADIKILEGNTLQTIPIGPGNAKYSIKKENGLWKAIVNSEGKEVGGKILNDERLPIDWNENSGETE